MIKKTPTCYILRFNKKLRIINPIQRAIKNAHAITLKSRIPRRANAVLDFMYVQTSARQHETHNLLGSMRKFANARGKYKIS